MSRTATGAKTAHGLRLAFNYPSTDPSIVKERLTIGETGKRRATDILSSPEAARDASVAPTIRATRNSRKEVIQPQVPLRLPCYDFAPVTELTLDGCLPKVSTPASGPPSFHGVTGGVYKARERIHRGVADPRLLAIPTS